jgi:large subunit ribosomal protein L21
VSGGPPGSGYRGPSSGRVLPAAHRGVRVRRTDTGPGGDEAIIDEESRREMYAIVKTGGKQYKVAVGDVIDVELLDGDKVDLQPVLLVDGSTVLSSAKDLKGVSITGNVVGDAKGPKIQIMKYKNKTGYKRRVGHRQRYSRIEIANISK